jgi:hypothetical protein
MAKDITPKDPKAENAEDTEDDSSKDEERSTMRLTGRTEYHKNY